MRILVTGASGFLGGHLCRRFVADGHQVTAFRRATSDLRALSGLAVEHIVGDITNPADVRQAVAGQEVVAHAAAHLTYWGQVRRVQDQVNVEGTRHVVAACASEGIRRLLHVSSVAAVGISSCPDQPADESFAFNLRESPLNYHISKWRAEQVVQAGVENGLDAVIVNPGSMFGPALGRYRGAEMIEKTRRTAFVPYFQGGINVVYVNDVVNGIVAALERGAAGRRYILGGENVTYRRIAEVAAKALGLHPRFVPVPAVASAALARLLEPVGSRTGKRPRVTYDVHYCSRRYQFYDSNRARRELGYAPKDFAQIVQDYLDWRRWTHLPSS